MTDEMWTIAEYAGCAAIGLGFFGWLVMLAYLWLGDRDRRRSMGRVPEHAGEGTMSEWRRVRDVRREQR
jgi:hypothetical protein